MSPRLRAGRSETLQNLTARVRARGPHLSFDAETLQAAFDASQGRFDASLERVMRALRDRESIAHIRSSDGIAVWLALQVASVVGRSEAVAAELAERFVLAGLDLGRAVRARLAGVRDLTAEDAEDVDLLLVEPELLEGLVGELAAPADRYLRDGEAGVELQAELQVDLGVARPCPRWAR